MFYFTLRSYGLPFEPKIMRHFGYALGGSVVLTELLAVWSRVLPEKLRNPLLDKKFPSYY
jgi:hypothetical protein